MTMLERVLEWLFRTKAIQRARQLGDQRDRLAWLAAANSYVESAKVIQFGDGRGTLLLLREATQAAIFARFPSPQRESELAALLDEHAEYVRAATSESRWSSTQRWLLDTNVHATDFVQNDRAVVAALTDIEQLIRHVENEYPSLEAQLARRSSTLTVGGVGLLLAVWGITSAIANATNLATGKSWQASSAYEGFTKTGVFEHASSTAFFHTQLETNPWMILDLGNTTYSAIEVTNRCDGYRERTVPLVIELSDDGAVWREVARKEEVFGEWDASFAKTTSRFVRFRVPRETYLHLCAIRVH